MDKANFEHQLQSQDVHSLPISVILCNAIDYGRISHLPANQDCTELLHVAAERVIKAMFPRGVAYVETFLPRREEFLEKMSSEIQDFSRGKWKINPSESLYVRPANSNI